MTGVGDSVLSGNTTGVKNTAVGYQGLSVNTTGTNNTAIGYKADVASAALTNATAIGNGATVPVSNSTIIGNGSQVALYHSGNVILNNPVIAAFDSTGTLGADKLIRGTIKVSSAVAVAITLPTVAAITSQLNTTPQQGTKFVFTIDNSASTSVGIVTLLVNTGITNPASIIVTTPIGTVQSFTLYYTSTTTMVFTNY